MPIQVIKRVAPSGGDHTTLAAAIAAIPADLVAIDTHYIIEIEDFGFPLTGINGLAINATTDATRFVEIRAVAGHEYDLSNDSGVRLTGAVGYGGILNTAAAYCLLDGLYIENIGTQPAAHGLSGLGHYRTLRNSVVKGINASGKYCVSANNGAYATYSNVVLIGGQYGLYHNNFSFDVTVDNVTAVDQLTAAFQGATSTSLLLTDTLHYGTGTPTLGSGFNGSSTNNATSASSGLVGANPVYNVSSDNFIDYAAGDYRIAAGSNMALASIGAFIQESAGNDQTITSGGIVSRTQSAEAIISITETQSVPTGGSANVTRSAAADTSIVNDTSVTQSVTSGGSVAKTLLTLATTNVVNAQEIASTGAISKSLTTIAVTQSVNEQSASTSGAVSVSRSAVADTQIVNDISSVQSVTSGGVVSRSVSAVANSQITEVQGIASGGIAATHRAAVAQTAVVNEYTIVQSVTSGGVCSVYRSVIATTEATIEQIISSGGTVAVTRNAVASTSFTDGDSEWSEPTILFSEPEEIQQISLTFDQLGRPFVFYRTGPDTLKIYWYDPIAQQNSVTVIAQGIDPIACFDFPHDTGREFTDVLLFYVRDNAIYMRQQRDRFAIEYATPETGSKAGLSLESAGLRVDNRVQAEYLFTDPDYVPPERPEVPPFPSGAGYYTNSWGGCFISNYPVNTVTDAFKIGFKVHGAYFPRYHEDRVRDGAYKQGQTLFGGGGRRQFYCYVSRDTRNNRAAINLWNGQRERNALFELETFDGEWEFEFYGNTNPVVKIIKDGNVIFNDWLSSPDPNKAAEVVLTFGGALYSVNSSDSYPLLGAVYDCWIEHNGNRIDWPVQSKGMPQQPSIPPGTDMTIHNHRSQNWKLLI